MSEWMPSTNYGIRNVTFSSPTDVGDTSYGRQVTAIAAEMGKVAALEEEVAGRSVLFAAGIPDWQKERGAMIVHKLVSLMA